MTISPLFAEQLVNLQQYKSFGGNKELPGSNQAADRFVRATSYLTSLPKPDNYRENVAYILSVMRTVADLTSRVCFFESTISPNIVWVRLDKLNFKAGAPVKKLDLVSELDLVGDVSRKFKKLKPFVFTGAEQEVGN